MRHAFVVAEFQPLGIDQDQPHLVGRGLVQDGHDHGIDGHALARARRTGNQQVRHACQIGGDDSAVDVFAHGQREFGLGADEFGRLDVLAQPDNFALAVRHLDADGGFARHALNQNDSAFSARQRSSVRSVMRLYLMPASGLNSKVVTTGPGLICVTCPWTSNSAYFSVSTWASSFNSSASIACCSSGRCSRLLGGSLNPPAAICGRLSSALHQCRRAR